MIYAKEFQNFCNSLDSGYLKEHKAFSMLVTMRDIPAIVSDSVRRLNYLENCLVMEGFSLIDIERINKYVIDNFE
jgi:hypothetical protein